MEARETTAPAVTWQIPRNVWVILVTWALAVVLLSGLFAFWQYRDQQAAKAAQREQDRQMCLTLDLFRGGPEPVPGPAGDRSRVVIARIHDQQTALGCDQLRPKPEAS
jgi:hypothetical protein